MATRDEVVDGLVDRGFFMPLAEQHKCLHILVNSDDYSPSKTSLFKDADPNDRCLDHYLDNEQTLLNRGVKCSCSGYLDTMMTELPRMSYPPDVISGCNFRGKLVRRLRRRARANSV